MVLLTSGQVSFALSSVVVFLFTTALFLSGYAVQQKTVRDLRAAIRPREVTREARLYLPPQFAGDAKPSPKERGRGDGVVIQVKQSENTKGNDLLLAENGNLDGQSAQKQVIELKVDERVQLADHYDLPQTSNSKPTQKTEQLVEERPISRAERRRKIKEEIMAGSEEAGFKGYRRRMW